MEQDPRYLANQSRAGHERYRRKQFWLNLGSICLISVFTTLLLLSIIDRIANLAWGLSDYGWEFLGLIACGYLNWLINTLINKAILAYVCHAYGTNLGD